MTKEIRVVTKGEETVKLEILKHLHALGYTWASGISLLKKTYEGEHIVYLSLHSGSKVRYGTTTMDDDKSVRYITYEQLKKDYPVREEERGNVVGLDLKLSKVCIKVKNEKQWDELAKFLDGKGIRFVDGDKASGYCLIGGRDLEGNEREIGYVCFDSNGTSIYLVDDPKDKDYTPISVKQFIGLVS